MVKKAAYISGALFSSITVLAVLFKLLHLTGATELLATGLIGFAVVFIPMYAKYKYDQSK